MGPRLACRSHSASSTETHRCRNSRARAMKRVSSASDTKSEADSRMLSKIRPQLVIAQAFNATYTPVQAVNLACVQIFYAGGDTRA